MPTIHELFDMTGRAAIVTGGGTHLGTAMAETLAELGASVYIASRRADLCQQVAAELRRRPLPGHPDRRLNVTGLGCDATDEKQVEALVSRVVNECGRLDVLIANAGGGRQGPYPPEGRVQDFIATLEMNMVSTYVSAQAAARAMIPKRRGSIVTLGSIVATVATDKRIYTAGFRRSGPHYTAAKGGVLMLTRALASDWGEHGITVNCVSPGQIPKIGVTDPEQVEKFRTMIPLQRTGMPDDLKGIVAVLASDAGRWITGQNFIVDGGWSAW